MIMRGSFVVVVYDVKTNIPQLDLVINYNILYF